MTAGVRSVLHVSAYGRNIAIERDDDSFELPYLPFAWRQTTPDAPIDRAYAVHRKDDSSWNVTIADEPAITLAGPDAVSEHLEGDLHHWLATFTRDYLFVHAGCASWRDRAIVIPGRSYAGKTTLTKALLEAGATYYSDDYAIIDPTGAIHPFPRQLRVRPENTGRSERVDPLASNWPIGTEPIRAGVIAALTYDADKGWNVETLSRGMGALSLLDNTVAARERPEDALRLMSLAMLDAIAIMGTRDDAHSTAHRLLAMVDELIDNRK